MNAELESNNNKLVTNFSEIYAEMEKLQRRAKNIDTTDFMNYENECKLLADDRGEPPSSFSLIAKEL